MVGHQQPEPAPLTTCEPIAHCTRLCMTFLQLGEVRTHRSVTDAKKFAGMTKDKIIHTTTSSQIVHLEPKIDVTENVVDPKLVTMSKDKIKEWASLMMQYNLKPGLRKFGAKGAAVAINKLTQLHIMDTWTAMDPSKLSREDQVKVLLSLLFLKEKETGKI